MRSLRQATGRKALRYSGDMPAIEELGIQDMPLQEAKIEALRSRLKGIMEENGSGSLFAGTAILQIIWS